MLQDLLADDDVEGLTPPRAAAQTSNSGYIRLEYSFQPRPEWESPLTSAARSPSGPSAVMWVSTLVQRHPLPVVERACPYADSGSGPEGDGCGEPSCAALPPQAAGGSGGIGGRSSEEPPEALRDSLHHNVDAVFLEPAVLVEPTLELALLDRPVVGGPALATSVSFQARSLRSPMALPADLEVHAVQVDQAQLRRVVELAICPVMESGEPRHRARSRAPACCRRRWRTSGRAGRGWGGDGS